MNSVIKLTINNAKIGVYTGRLYVGKPAQAIDVILDTGSSILALDGNSFNVNEDNNAQPTGQVQTGKYVLGGWSGNVYKTNVNLQTDGERFNLRDVSLAITKESQDIFNGVGGILGLAYQELDHGIEKTVAGHLVKSDETITPYFTQLVKSGLVANTFSFYTLRANPDVVSPDLNNGYLILGGGEEFTELYSGEFQSVKITHDQYYNVNLRAIRVGDQVDIKVAPAESVDSPNCIVDSGTNGLVFPESAYSSLLTQFANINSQFGDIIEQALKSHSYLQSQLNLEGWPDIIVTLEGESGDVELRIKPDNYWQLNSGRNKRGELLAGLQFFGSGSMAIMGLPLINNYFTVFDRSAGNGVGLIKFAPMKKQ